jgi:hypothetical protein
MTSQSESEEGHALSKDMLFCKSNRRNSGNHRLGEFTTFFELPQRSIAGFSIGLRSQ